MDSKYIVGAGIGVIGTVALMSYLTNRAMCRTCNDPAYTSDPARLCREIKDKNSC